MTDGLNRREFIATVAAAQGAFVLGFWMPSRKAEAAIIPADLYTRPEPWYRDAQVPEINAWLTIGPDDTVTIRIGQVDLGTGVDDSGPGRRQRARPRGWRQT